MPPRMRASDADREATVQVLQQALARGLLPFEEAGGRMTVAYAALFVADLAELTADLPSVDPGGDGGGARSWMARRIVLAGLLTVALVVVVVAGMLLLALGGIALRDLLQLAGG